MRCRICMISLVVALLSAATPCLGWKFASIADSRGSSNGVNTAELTAIVNRVNAENVALVLFQGDAVTGSSNNTTLGSQMDTWLSTMNQLNCPWYYTCGNHEVVASGSEAVLRGKVNMPLNGPPGYEEMVYSFNYQNAHFVALNSDHYGEVHRVQRSWLTGDLAAAGKPHIFAMAHEPAYPVGPHAGSSLDVYPSERNDLWSIMTNAHVGIYFCGHEHLYARSKVGAIYQVINGTCGAPINSGYAGTVAQYQYVIVDINGGSVHCEAKNDTGAIIDSWDYAVDATPPDPVTGFNAASGDGVVSLSWTNPTAADFAGTKVYFKTTEYPASVGDGTLLYDGTGTTCQHSGVTNGTRYYYSAFARDGYWNYSSAANARTTPAAEATVAQAKSLDDGEKRLLKGKTVSATFGGFFYVEEPSQRQGIKALSLDPVSIGNLVDVVGVLGGSGSERYLDSGGDPAIVTASGSGGPLAQAMGNVSLGGAAMNAKTPGVAGGLGAHNIGLLVTVWGRITQRDTTGLEYFYIDDGVGLKDGTTTDGVENVGVRVKADPTAYPAGSYVAATGISCFTDGGLRPQILPRAGGVEPAGSEPNTRL